MKYSVVLSALMLIYGIRFFSFSQDSLAVTAQTADTQDSLAVTTQTADTQDSLAVTTQTPDTVKQEKKILIARQESEFKHALMLQIKKRLKEHPYHVECIDLKSLKKKESKQYDAIVIINEVRAWHLNMHNRQFLDKLDPGERKKILMVSTAKTDWKIKKKDIDAVTVASEMNKVEPLADKIVTKIQALLSLP